jgi:hypothetical protein
MSYELNKINLLDDKKSFRIRYCGVNKILLNIENIYSPFGIEKYNNKDILNLVLSSETNQNYNNIVLIKELDNYFKNLHESKKELNNLCYTSPIKIISDNKIQIRTHLAKKINIKSNNQQNIEIKNKNFNIELEFSSIWKYNQNYGIVLTVNIIDLTRNC